MLNRKMFPICRKLVQRLMIVLVTTALGLSTISLGNISAITEIIASSKLSYNASIEDACIISKEDGIITTNVTLKNTDNYFGECLEMVYVQKLHF